MQPKLIVPITKMKYSPRSLRGMLEYAEMMKAAITPADKKFWREQIVRIKAQLELELADLKRSS